jgi:serine/threonine protein kinase
MDRVEQQLGNYRLKQVLGKGAFADVYLGEHLYLSQRSHQTASPGQNDSDACRRAHRREAGSFEASRRLTCHIGIFRTTRCQKGNGLVKIFNVLSDGKND